MGAPFLSQKAPGQQIPTGIWLCLLSPSATTWAVLSPGRQCHSRTASMVTKPMELFSFSSHATRLAAQLQPSPWMSPEQLRGGFTLVLCPRPGFTPGNVLLTAAWQKDAGRPPNTVANPALNRRNQNRGARIKSLHPKASKKLQHLANIK